MSQVRSRREALGLTQQEAARRADVSLATWRRIEASEGPLSVRQTTLEAVERALKLPKGGLAALRAGASVPEVDTARAAEREWLQTLVRTCTGDPLTARQGFRLSMAAAGMEDDAFVQWDDYLLGRCTVDELHLVSALPDWVLFVANNVWLQRFRQTIVEIGGRLERGQLPYPQSLAERVALWILLQHAQEGGVADDLLDKGEFAATLPEHPDDEDWESAEEKLFDGDFDFRFIWLPNFTRVVFGGDPSSFGNQFGIDVGGYHPFRWWETDPVPLDD